MKDGCPKVEVRRDRREYQKNYHIEYVKRRKQKKKAKPGLSVLRVFIEGDGK